MGKHLDDAAQRYLFYLLSPLLFGVLMYIAIRFFSPSNFVGDIPINLFQYVLATAFNFGLSLHVFEEWLSRWAGTWAERQRRTVGATCLLWWGGFLMAIIMQLIWLNRSFGLDAVSFSAGKDGILSHGAGMPLILIIIAALWFFTLIIRLAFGLLLQRYMQRNHEDEEKIFLQNMSRWLAQCGLESISPPHPGRAKHPKLFFITTGQCVQAVAPEYLVYISSEGHYCRFIIHAEERVKEIFTRAALREVMTKLPPEDFIQVHRSHVININHIVRLKKTGRAHSLYLKGAKTPLPISRHRWPAIRDRLKPAP